MCTSQCFRSADSPASTRDHRPYVFPRDFYEILHVIGIALIFIAIGGVAVHSANGGDKATNRVRRLLGISHGVGALLILVGGFGMLARIGLKHGEGFPGWLWTKIIIWVIVSALVLLPYRRPALARPFLILTPLLAGVAVYMALYKPF